jgi:hypothetical protein
LVPPPAPPGAAKGLLPLMPCGGCCWGGIPPTPGAPV